ncbi:MAG: DsbA family protein [Phenylobacterium sp.]|nr:DsbA family protein [Phenylobacterium sp.]
MSLGDPKAPVHVVEYLSLTCPHCAHFHADVFPAFKARYIDTGRVYFTVRELLTAPANVAAAGVLMARCKGDAATYFRIVDQVFRSQARWQQGSIKPLFLEIARQNGLTEAQFEACLVDEKASEALQARLEYATGTDKVTGTPTFFVNGVLLPNQTVPTLAELDAAIARALKLAGRR